MRKRNSARSQIAEVLLRKMAGDRFDVFTAGTERIHWSFEDPAALTGTDEERLRAYRAVRDAIQQRLQFVLSVCA